MEKIAASLLGGLGGAPAGAFPGDGQGVFRRYGENAGFFLVPGENARELGVVALREKFLPGGFSGERSVLKGGGIWLRCPCDDGNAAALRRCLPDCAPAVPEGGEEIVFASPSGKEAEKFPVFLAGKGEIPEMLRRATFAAFGRKKARPFAVGAVVLNAAEAKAALDAGATYLVLRPDGGDAPAVIAREEYAGRVFVPGGVKVEIGASFFASSGETAERMLSAALKTAEAVSARGAAWHLELPDFGPVPLHLVLARELFRRGAPPRETVVRCVGEEEKVRAAIAAHYGKYVKQTV